MKRTQQGFTLIELVMVIVILGILAATAIPRFVDLSAEAQAAALPAIAGTFASAMAINFAGCSANSHTPGPNCLTVDNCDDTATLLQDGALPSGYTVAALNLTTTNGATGVCVVTQTATTNTANFTGIAAGN